MRTQLLSIGFIEQPDGSFYNSEIHISVQVVDTPEGERVEVPTPKGLINATIEELEDAIVSGGFGEF